MAWHWPLSVHWSFGLNELIMILIFTWFECVWAFSLWNVVWVTCRVDIFIFLFFINCTLMAVKCEAFLWRAAWMAFCGAINWSAWSQHWYTLSQSPCTTLWACKLPVVKAVQRPAAVKLGLWSSLPRGTEWHPQRAVVCQAWCWWIWFDMRCLMIC